jgi:hypothetical protein
MRILLVIILPIAAAVAAALYFAPEFRQPRHVYYLVQCTLSPSITVRHIVTSESFDAGKASMRGTSVKGYKFAYAPSTPCTKHPITGSQVQEYLASTN